TPESMSHISRQIDRSLVDVVVTLAETKISTGDLLGLRVGDVVTTDKDVRSPLEVAVQGVSKFLASPGSIKGQKAIQIESAVPTLSLAPTTPSAKPPAGK
ncbi:MAG: FliM/FliN family flagellar motor switch protein, partial [Pirellulaceae bacterium]